MSTPLPPTTGPGRLALRMLRLSAARREAEYAQEPAPHRLAQRTLDEAAGEASHHDAARDAPREAHPRRGEEPSLVQGVENSMVHHVNGEGPLAEHPQPRGLKQLRDEPAIDGEHEGQDYDGQGHQEITGGAGGPAPDVGRDNGAESPELDHGAHARRPGRGRPLPDSYEERAQR